MPFLGLGRPDAHYPIMRSSIPTEDGLWSSCDIAHGECESCPATIARAHRGKRKRGGDGPGQHRARTG